MLLKEEWKLLVRYYDWAKDDVNGTIYFPEDCSEDQANGNEPRNRLIERGFIEPQDIGIHEGICRKFNLPYLRLTAAGKDEALIYNSWFKRTGLCFRELKGHWIWLIVAGILSIAGTIFVQWVCKRFLG
ncbi:MAG: hypothetical protein ACYTEL_03945 [Planctomycetota bacterium]|jgi:hypothetical protein